MMTVITDVTLLPMKKHGTPVLLREALKSSTTRQTARDKQKATTANNENLTANIAQLKQQFLADVATSKMIFN